MRSGKAKGPFAAGRRVLSDETARKRQMPETTPEEREEIRSWAQDQGHEFDVRGRVPKKIMPAYDKAHDVVRAD